MNELLSAGIESQAAALRTGKISAEELARGYLERIERLNKTLNGYVNVTAEDALAAAREADRRLARKDDASLLLGIPIAVKDIIDVANVPTTYGSKAFLDNVPAADSGVVRSLKKGGAVVLGKANTLEFAFINPSPAFGASKNTWSPDHVAGGSSNGSGTIVSAEMATAALGTDTAGSVRIPASCNGVVGLKPTHGRVSIRGVGCLSWSMDTIGALTRSVADAATMLETMAGFDNLDPWSVDVPPGSYLQASKMRGPGLRIGHDPKAFADRTHPELIEAVQTAVARLSNLGCTVREVELPALDRYESVWFTLSGAEDNVWHEKTLDARGADYGGAVRQFLLQHRDMKATSYIKAKQAQWELKQRMLQAMSDVDVIVLPTTLAPPWRPGDIVEGGLDIGGKRVPIMKVAIGVTSWFNITGQPALAVPSGLSKEGLPLSVQFVGKPFCEAATLRAGALFESVSDWKYRRPPMVAESY